MSYIIRHCEKCGKEYHVHDNGSIKGACKHVSIDESRGRKLFRATMADTVELDKMLEEEQVRSRRKRSKHGKPRSG